MSQLDVFSVRDLRTRSGELLKELYSTVWISTEVHREFRPESNFPGAIRLSEAITEGWLRVEILADEFKNKLADLSMVRIGAVTHPTQCSKCGVPGGARSSSTLPRRRHSGVGGIVGVL